MSTEPSEVFKDKAGRQLHVGDYLVVVLGGRSPFLEFARITAIKKTKIVTTVHVVIPGTKYKQNPADPQGRWLAYKASVKSSFRSLDKFYWISQHSLPEDVFTMLDSVEIQP